MNVNPKRKSLHVNKLGAILFIACALQGGCIPAMVTKSPGSYGRVTDARSHRPVAGARVCFPSLRDVAATTTDVAGRYDLPSSRKLGIVVLLPFEFGNTPLQITHPGYLPFTTPAFFDYHHQEHNAVLQLAQ